jgi:type IV pilus biogenesis protein PilP
MRLVEMLLLKIRGWRSLRTPFSYSLIILFSLFCAAGAEDEFVDVESYDAESSVFQKIADLEQEKVLLQLEKERAQLQLDLERIAAESVRMTRDQENDEAARAAAEAEIEKQKAAIESERAKLEEQKKRAAEDAKKAAAAPKEEKVVARAEPKETEEQGETETISDKYGLREIIGAGNQLFATLENLGTGKQKKISVGKNVDGYIVKSISIDDGVELEKDGETFTIGVGAFVSGE